MEKGKVIEYDYLKKLKGNEKSHFGRMLMKSDRGDPLDFLFKGLDCGGRGNCLQSGDFSFNVHVISLDFEAQIHVDRHEEEVQRGGR